jgi:hypothetical protein
VTRVAVQVLCINEEVARLRSGARISEKCLDLQQQRAKRQAGAGDAATPGSSKAKVTAVSHCSLQDLHVDMSAWMPGCRACLHRWPRIGTFKHVEPYIMRWCSGSRGQMQYACPASMRYVAQARKGKGGCPFMAAPQKAGAAFRAGLLAAPRDVEELVSHPPAGLHMLNKQRSSLHIGTAFGALLQRSGAGSLGSWGRGVTALRDACSAAGPESGMWWYARCRWPRAGARPWSVRLQGTPIYQKDELWQCLRHRWRQAGARRCARTMLRGALRRRQICCWCPMARC